MVGGLLYEQGCSGGGFDTETWNPDPQVGAGSAGNNTQQLVNYSEFGRCLDVTDQNPSATWLIAYPCKQAPSPTNIAWNQRYTYDATANTLSTTTRRTARRTASRRRPRCPARRSTTSSWSRPATVPTNQQKWTESGDTGSYATSYTIVNAAGYCLSVVQPGLGDTYTSSGAPIVAAMCDGSLVQKWNAPANFIDSRFKGTAEDQGGQ